LLATAVEAYKSGRKFEINIQYTCTTITNGGCSSWSSGGSMEESAGCFPGDSLVLSQRGLKRMDMLEVGDMIMGHDTATGLDVFTPVRSWLHRFPTTDYTYMKLHTKKGDIEVAKYHNLAVAVNGAVSDYIYAEEFEVGSHLWTREGPEEVLSKTERVENVGLYAPLTLLSNFYIGTNASTSLFLAHAFAHVRHPNSMAPVLHGVMSACEWFDGGLHELDDKAEYVHPVARRLQAVFPFLLDKAPTKFQVQAASSSSKKKYEYNTFFSTILSANPLLFCSSPNCGSSSAVALNLM
jgi:hypothetical protein